MTTKKGKKGRKPPAQVQSARVDLLFPPDLKERAKAAAKADGRSLNNWIVRLVDANC